MVLQHLRPLRHWFFPLWGHIQQTSSFHSQLPDRIITSGGHWLFTDHKSKHSHHSDLTSRQSQASMKQFADIHRCDVQFSVDDWVLILLRPYCQTSLTPTYTKLGKHFYGPFQIEAHIGPVAYSLQLPTSFKIHLVFHVSLLKLYHGPSLVDQQPLSLAACDNHLIVEPMTILD